MLHQTFKASPSAQPPVLHATGLSGGPGDADLFQHIDVHLPAGVSALIGDEGSGKTSLLRLLAGDLLARSGQLRLQGADCAWAHVQPASVFWLDLRLPTLDAQTPAQCWDQWRETLPLWNASLQQALVTALHMTPHLDKRLDMLSTGSRRKVGLVAALACGATVTLLDQPFVSLDAASIRVIQDVLTDAAEQPNRAWLVADYETTLDGPLASVLHLDRLA